MTFLKKLDAAVKTALRALTICLLALLGLLLLGNVFLRLMGDLAQFLHSHDLDGVAAAIRRILPITSFHWLDEIVELCFSALIFYGAAVLWAMKGHFSVGDWISRHLPEARSRMLYRSLISAMNVAFFVLLFYFGYTLCARSTELSTVFQIPKRVMYSSIPVSAAIMFCYAAADLVKNLTFMVRGRDSGEVDKPKSA
ncbi:MAG: TRAP transporter small permease [Spirochaetaceae bacterium]|jgi:TRAP-type C4-dicarboxylate transport system permease small subunit|nr:TRAP transporter small permease [Spirochaetaceae bacterium]